MREGDTHTITFKKKFIIMTNNEKNEISHRRHRKYRLTQHLDTYSEVLDLEDNTTYICFKLDKHEVGDIFYLFEQTRERRNLGGEKVIFNYSILNDYEPNKTYKFDIEEERSGLLLVRNSLHLRHAVPAYFRDEIDQKVIELEVQNLDLDKNRLQFKKKEEVKLEMTTSLDHFELNRNYEFELKKYFLNRWKNLVFIVEHNNKNYYLNPPPHLSRVKFKSPVIANITTNEDGTERYLRLSHRYLSESLYEVGQKYTFTIVEQVENSRSGISFWVVADWHGNRCRYFPDGDLTFNDDTAKLREGDSIELTVLSITDRGHVKLITDIKDWQDKGYLVEEVFEAIGYEDGEEKYFFKYANVLGIDDEEMEDRENTFLVQYNEGNNLWVFSYLSFLDEEVYNDLEAGEFENAKTLIDIYIKIEKWVLEGSDYLTNFSRYKIDGIIIKAEHKIVKLEATLAAIDIFLEGKDVQYIEQMNAMLARTPYLNAEKKEVFKQFLNISQYFRVEADFEELSGTIFLMLERNLITEDDLWIFINTINSFIYRIKMRINELLEEEDATNGKSKELKQLIIYHYLLICLYVMEGKSFNASATTVNLLRNLSLYHNQRGYVDLAIELIIRNGYIKPSVSRHREILDFDEQELKKICVYEEDREMTLLNAGNVLSLQGNFTIVPKNLLHVGNGECRLKTLAKLGDFDLYVKSHFNLDAIDPEDEKDVVIERAIKAIKHNSMKSDYELNQFSYRELDISFEKVYVGTVNNIQPKGNYCYLAFEADGQTIDTLLHINNFHKNKLAGNMHDFLREGDQVRFKVVNVYDDKVTISPADYIYDYAKRVVDEDKVHYGRVMMKPLYSDCKVMTTDGMAVSLVNSNYEVGQTVKLKIAEIKENSHWHIAYWHEECDEEITVDSGAAFRDYLIATGMLIEDDGKGVWSNGSADKMKRAGYIVAENNSKSLRMLSTFLIGTLEQRLNYISDPKEMAINYFFIITLSGVMKHPKSFEYSNKLNNLARIVKLEFAKDMELINSGIDEVYFDEERLEELNQENSTIEMLKYMNTDLIELPITVNPSSAQYKLKKLIEAINLIRSYDLGGKIVGAIKNLVVHELYNTLKVSDNSINELQLMLADEPVEEKVEKPKRVVTNLGAESKLREFKRSIFHSASEVNQQDVIMRTICGFLNAYEGTGYLYIGVDDSGEIRGLKEDLSYMKDVDNLDRYQNYLQQMVVRAFPKEINSILDYKFYKSNNLNYLEIVIPSHDKPVTYRDEFYQRQGVQTRILKGQDITDFIVRKTSGYGATSRPIAMVPQSDATTLLDKREVLQDKWEVVELASQKGVNKEQEKLKGDVIGGKFAVYSFDDEGVEDEEVKPPVNDMSELLDSESDNLLCYLYILRDDRNIRYMLSANKIKEYEMEVEITERYRGGYLLFCYDNACVNKVAVRNIISKSFNIIYMNAIGNQGKLLRILTTLPSEEIGIETTRLNKNYVKLYDVDNIAEHRVIGLKGSCIIEGSFDKVVAYYHNSQMTDELDMFRQDSKAGFGREVAKHLEEYEMLKELSK